MYTFQDDDLGDSSGVTKCRCETGRLPLVFYKVYLRLVEVLGGTSSQTLTTQMVEVYENVDRVTEDLESFQWL